MPPEFHRPVTMHYRFGEYTVDAYQFLSSGSAVQDTLTLAGARLWFPDGTTWCWWWDGDKYVTLQPNKDVPVGADLNGNGIPDLLVQRHTHRNDCDSHVYLIELGDPPRFLYRAEGRPGEPVCWVGVENVGNPGNVRQLMTTDTSFGPRSDDDTIGCPTPYLQVIYTPDENGVYQVAEPQADSSSTYPEAFRRAYQVYLGRYFNEYGDELLNDRHPERRMCATFSLAMVLLYQGEDPNQVRWIIDALYPGNMALELWRSAVARAASSGLVGHRFR